MSLDYAKIREAANGYRQDMTAFLRDMIALPSESSEEEASDETGGDASENESAEPAEDGQTEKPAE